MFTAEKTPQSHTPHNTPQIELWELWQPLCHIDPHNPTHPTHPFRGVGVVGVGIWQSPNHLI